MSRILLGAICGVLFGIIDVGSMIPLSLPDKTIAMAGAFFNCLAIGIVIGAANLPLPGWLTGLIMGVLITLPTTIITGKYIPILIVAAIGGAIVGFVVGRWGV